jgi:hypothetical protein
MVGFFKDLSKEFVYFLYDLVLIAQDLLLKFYLLLKYCIGFAQHFLVCFGFDMIQIWKVLEEQCLSIGICVFGLFTLVFWLYFCTHFPINLSK